MNIALHESADESLKMFVMTVCYDDYSELIFKGRSETLLRLSIAGMLSHPFCQNCMMLCFLVTIVRRFHWDDGDNLILSQLDLANCCWSC
ncbi:MAG: hypothetical protein KDD70_06510 [Bdellovibrionales bacterium]|nr:hypothetical protein [Bdellovibrionales bacterium]